MTARWGGYYEDMKEKYEPTPEEVKKAEEMMTPSEKKLSEKRKGYVESTSEFPVAPKDNPFHFERIPSMGNEYLNLKGRLGGHKFELSKYVDKDEDPYTGRNRDALEPYRHFYGTVDGMTLPGDVVKKLYDKYISSTLDESNFRRGTEDLENKAREEARQATAEFRGSKEDQEEALRKLFEDSKKESEEKVAGILKELTDKGLI